MSVTEFSIGNQLSSPDGGGSHCAFAKRSANAMPVVSKTVFKKLSFFSVLVGFIGFDFHHCYSNYYRLAAIIQVIINVKDA